MNPTATKPLDTTPVALITGATGGLGLALVRYLVREGWHVFAADCDAKGLEALKSEKQITPLMMDVTQTASIEAARAQVQEQVQYLDAVVNFAGVLRVGAMVEVEEALFARLMDINLFGTYRVNKAFFHMLRRPEKPGRIVNISSETGWHTAAPFNGPYATSKHAVEAYSDALRRELSLFGVHVIKVQPGPFKTTMVSGVVSDFDRAAEHSKLYQKPLRYWGRMTGKANAKAHSPDVLAAVIHRALTCANPKVAYSVKADPGRTFLEFLPMRWSDAIFRKVMEKA